MPADQFETLRKKHLIEFRTLIQNNKELCQSDGFAELLTTAFVDYGLDKSKLLSDLRFSKSSVSKWSSAQAKPNLAKIKLTVEWITEEIERLL